MNQRPIKICFVSVHTYPVINPKAPGLFGGIEKNSWDFAREVARLPGTEVSIVVNHRSAPRRSVVDGVTVIEATDLLDWCRQDLSTALRDWRERRIVPWTRLGSLFFESLAYAGSRLFRPKSTGRWQTPSRWITDSQADVYLAFGVNHQACWTQLSANSQGRPTIFCVMSDSDIDPQFHSDADYVNQYGVSSTMARALIGESQGIVSQTLFQQEQLRSVWGRDSIVISNLVDLEEWDVDMKSPLPPELPESPFVLWVGRADRFHKRPLEMVYAIRSNPAIHFVMVLNPSDQQVLDELKSYAFANLTVIDRLTTQQMAAVMRAATAFVSTGSVHYEGLPSVLLQAAASSTPIVSLEVSAPWLDASRAGVCVHGDQRRFSETIAHFVINRNAPDVIEFATNGREFVEANHDARKQAAKLLDYARQIVDSTSQGPATRPGAN